MPARFASVRFSTRILLATSLLSGCGRDAAKGPAEIVKPPSTSKTEVHTLRGVVREVDAKQKVVTIAHEAMPGFMGKMTMPFTVAKGEMLEDVRPGDAVEGPIRVVREGGRVASYELENLVVTEPAPVTFKLSTGAGGATLSEARAVLKPGEKVPDFAMTTQEGKPLRLSDLAGKVVVLTFIYTRCPLPDFCPASDVAFGELANRLGDVGDRAERVRLLSISFDPEHDTPEVLRAHAKRRGAVPPLWTYAVASHEELRKVAGPLGLTYGPTKDEIIHNLSTAVIGEDGRLIRLDRGKAGIDWTVPALMKSVVDRLRESKK